VPLYIIHVRSEQCSAVFPCHNRQRNAVLTATRTQPSMQFHRYQLLTDHDRLCDVLVDSFDPRRVALWSAIVALDGDGQTHKFAMRRKPYLSSVLKERKKLGKTKQKQSRVAQTKRVV